MVQPSLLKALYKAYGLPYLLLGIIKLVNDILNFAGPILLNVLIRYLETPSEPFDHDGHKAASGQRWLPQPDSLAFGLCCAALLGITSLIKVRASACLHHTLQRKSCPRLNTQHLNDVATHSGNNLHHVSEEDQGECLCVSKR